MPYFQNRYPFMVVFALVSAIAVNILTAQNGDSPPVQYEIRSFAMPTLHDGLEVHAMNNLGQIVGRYTDAGSGSSNGFVYDPTIDELQAFDLNHLVQVPQGWWIGDAYDINDAGQIVGNLVETNGAKVVPLVIDLYQAQGPEMIVLPDLGVSNLRGRKINNDGDVIVAYDATGGTSGTQPPDVYHFHPGIDFASQHDDFLEVLPFRRNGTFDLSSSFENRPGQIAGKLTSGEPFLFTLGDASVEIPTDLSGARVMSRINDHGVVVGSMEVPYRRNKTIPMDFRYDKRNADPLETFDISSTRPQTLNNDGDFTISSVNRLLFYHEGSGFFELNENDLVGDQQLIDDWTNKNFVFMKDLTMRGATIWETNTDFPTMSGYFIDPSSQMIAVVLIPLSSEPSPGISVTPTNGLTTTEAGAQATFDVVLDTPPSADVMIDISSNDTNEGTVDKSSLIFSSATWDTPQQVTITGQGDGLPDGNDVAYTIVTAPATSIDLNYDGLDAENIQVTNLDPSSGGSETYSTLDKNPDPDPPIEILDNDPDGISSTILMGDHTISTLTVNLNISHQRPSDLDVYLIGPNGMAQLSNFSGDNNVADFYGTSTNGSWTLEVYDTRKKRTGTLNSWSITVDYD